MQAGVELRSWAHHQPLQGLQEAFPCRAPGWFVVLPGAVKRSDQLNF